MSLSFLGKKGFHPSSPKNLKKLFEAEEEKKSEDTTRTLWWIWKLRGEATCLL